MSDGNGALPEGWAATTFGDIFDFKGGSQPPKKEFVNEPRDGFIRLLQIRDFASDQFPVYIKDADRWPKCAEDDVMIARYGASLGRVLTGMGGAYNVALIKMIFDRENIDTGWARYFLMSNHFQGPIHLLSRSAQNGFNKKEVAPIQLQLPPLAEQRRIVSKIESLQERSSRARRAFSEVGPLLEQFRQSVLRAAFSGRLTADWRAATRDVEPAPELLSRIRTERRHRWEQSELAKYEAKGKKPPQNWQDKYKEPEPVNERELPELPDGWCWATLDELLSEPLANGRSVRDGNGTPVLRLTALRNRRIDLNETKLGDWTEEQAQKFFVHENDFLVSRGNGSIDLVGRGGIVAKPETPIAFPDTLIRVRLTERVAIGLFAFLWDSRLVRDQVESAAKTTAGIYKVSQSDLEAFVVPVVPEAEQPQIVEMLTAGLRSVDEMEREVTDSESSLTQLDQSILAKAFRGALVPQDPRDEPASELLARIHPAVKEGKQAEFLVFERFPWELVDHVGVFDRNLAKLARAAIRNSSHQPTITVENGWYF